MFLFVKLEAEACNFTKVTLLHGCFSHFLNCANSTKSHKASHIFVSGLSEEERAKADGRIGSEIVLVDLSSQCGTMNIGIERMEVGFSRTKNTSDIPVILVMNNFFNNFDSKSGLCIEVSFLLVVSRSVISSMLYLRFKFMTCRQQGHWFLPKID